jgi:hypothetical protein
VLRKVSKRSVKPGDFFEVRLPNGYGYLRFLGRYSGPLPMDAFAVLDNPGLKRLDDAGLAQLKERYFIGGSAKYLKRDPNFKVISSKEPAPMEIPRDWRMTRLKGWSVVSNGREGPSQELDDAMAKLPILSILPAEIIAERISSNWKPEHSRQDSLTGLLAAIRNAPTTAPKTITVFLDFNSEKDAKESAVDFKQHGYDVGFGKSRRSLEVTAIADIDSDDWIATAEHGVMAIALLRGGRCTGNEVQI